MTKGELKKREEMNNLALRSELLTESLAEQHQRRDLLIKSNDTNAEQLKALKRGLEENRKGWETGVDNVFGDMAEKKDEGNRTQEELLVMKADLIQKLTAEDVIGELLLVKGVRLQER